MMPSEKERKKVRVESTVNEDQEWRLRRIKGKEGVRSFKEDGVHCMRCCWVSFVGVVFVVADLAGFCCCEEKKGKGKSGVLLA